VTLILDTDHISHLQYESIQAMSDDETKVIIANPSASVGVRGTIICMWF